MLIAALVARRRERGHRRLLRRSGERRRCAPGEPAARRRRDGVRRSSVAEDARRRGAATRTRRIAGAPIQQHGATRRRRCRKRARCWPTSRPSAPAIRCAARSCWSPPTRPTACAPRAFRSAGEAWPDARLAARLGAGVGDTIAVGEATLKVTCDRAAGTRSRERTPRDRTAPPAQPRRRAGDESAAARQPRTWRLLVADLSQRDSLDPYRKWLQAELQPGQRMENIRDLRPEVRQTLDRAEQFLGLSALVAVLLAAVAVALAASRYLRRHLDTAAMLRCFGASRRQTLVLFVLQFALLGLAASVVGIVLALLGQQLLVTLLGSIAAGDLPAPAPLPAVAAFATGVFLLLGFALPPLVALAGVPPMRVLRRDLPRPAARGHSRVSAGRGRHRAADRLAGAGREDRRDHGRRYRGRCSPLQRCPPGC